MNVDSVLLRHMDASIALRRHHTAVALARIGIADEQKLYASTDPSIEDWCLRELGVDPEDVDTFVLAARAARRFPEAIHAMADGRLNPWTVAMMAPYLGDDETAGELMIVAEYMTESQLEKYLAVRFSS